MDTSRRTLGIKIHESFVQLAAISMTALYILWAALLTMSTLSFQCAAIAECRQNRWWMDPFGTGFFTDHPGRRVIVGLVIPLALLGLFVALGKFSRTRYDNYGEDGGAVDDLDSGSLLGRRAFWYSWRWQQQTSRFHVAMVLLILGGLLGRVATEFEKRFDVDVVPDVGVLVFWASIAAALVTGVALVVSTFKSDDLLDGTALPGWISWALLAVAGTLFTASVFLTWRLDLEDSALVPPQPGADLLTPVTDLWGFGWAPILLLALAISFVGVFSLVQLWRWLAWRQIYLDQMVIVVMLAYIALWKNAVAVAMGAVLAAVLAEVAQWLASRSRAKRPDLGATWRRLATYLVTVAVGVVAWFVTRDADSPYGEDWPRLTPLIVFSVTLLVMNAAKLARTATTRVWLALVAVTLSIAALGYAFAGLSGREEWRYAALGLAFVVLAIVWLAQHEFWGWRWNGPAAMAIFALAILMGAFSGGALRLVDFLDRGGSVFTFRATAIYEWLVIGFVAIFAAGLVGFVVWLVMVRLGAPPTGHGAEAVTNWAETLAEGVRAVDVVVTVVALTVITGGLSLVMHLVDAGVPTTLWIDFGVPADWSALVDLASWITLAMVVGAFAQVRSGLRDPASRKRLGKLWDVASFWPRTFHPFAPPAYASRAVPELQSRLIECATAATGHQPDETVDPNGVTIVTAHSQGTVISIAAVATLPLEVRCRTYLVTHGSPLCRFYQRFFPRYFPDKLFKRAAETLGPTDLFGDGSWLNFWRSTDPIGDPIFRGIRDRPGKLPAALHPALNRSQSQLAENPDFHLWDPIRDGVNPHQLENPARGHFGYIADPAMSEAVDAIASLPLPVTTAK